MTTPRALVLGAALIAAASLLVHGSSTPPDHPDLSAGSEWISLSADVGIVLDASVQKSMVRSQGQLTGVLHVRRNGAWHRVMLVNQAAVIKTER